MKDLTWFKNEFEKYLSNYEVKHKFFKDGDLGDLNQVEFNSKEKGGEIEFWSSGWLYVHFVDYISGDELLNVLLKPELDKQQDIILEDLKNLL